MFKIKNIQELRKLRNDGSISSDFYEHLVKKIEELRNNLTPESSLKDFSLEKYGPVVVLTDCEYDLGVLGTSKELSGVVAEKVEYVSLRNEDYYVVYLMGNNDYITQIYISADIENQALQAWLTSQMIAKDGEKNVSKQYMPF